MSTLSSTEAYDFCKDVYNELKKEGKTTQTSIHDMAKAIRKVAPQHNVSIPTPDKRSTLEAFSPILNLASLKQGRRHAAKELTAIFTQLPVFGELSEEARYTARVAEKLFSKKEISDLDRFIIRAKEKIISAEFAAQKLDKGHRTPILKLLLQAHGLLEKFGEKKFPDVQEKLVCALEYTQTLTTLMAPKVPSYLETLQSDIETVITEIDDTENFKDPKKMGTLNVKKKKKPKVEGASLD